MTTKIAKAMPFEGKPIINMPSVYGTSTSKEILYRIPVIGKRPISLAVEGLKEGLDYSDGIISGVLKNDCEFTIKIVAENELGKSEKDVLIKNYPDNPLLTPLMGFCTWMAYGMEVTQNDMERTAKTLIDSGIADYGYNYINLDSGWQEKYGGEFNAVIPNNKFKNMKEMCNYIHSLGLKVGIYSTPMLTAWGCPKEFDSIPGCTIGEPDKFFTYYNGGIGKIHMEENNVRQWDEWGFDYLKYDWAPAEPINADYMKQALLKSKREIAFCVTVMANLGYALYWRENCNSWRDNDDVNFTWANIRKRIDTVKDWGEHVKQGHFYDLDMLAIGKNAWNDGILNLTEDEELFAYTMRAFFLSPIQLSLHIDKLTDFEFDLICNEEMIKINQDSLADYPKLIYTYENLDAKIYKRKLENGDYAIAIFNMDSIELTDKLLFEEPHKILNVWTKEVIDCTSTLNYVVNPHSVQVYRIVK